MILTRHPLTLALLAIGLLSAAPARGGGRVQRAEFEFIGPLAGVTIETGKGARLALEGALALGEERRAVLLLPLPPGGARDAPRVRWELDDGEPRGRVRFVGWIEEGASSALPPGLRGRARTPVELARSTPTLAAVVLLGALAFALASLRARARLAMGLALGVGLVAASLARAPESRLRSAHVLEGALDTETWIAIHSAAQVLELPAPTEAGEGTLELEPPHAELRFEAALRGSGPTVCLAPRARLHWLRTLPAPPNLSPTSNGWRSCDATWTRADAVWRSHGAWFTRQELPAPRPGPDPPGWLCAGLPQGVGLFLGQWNEGGVVHHVRVSGW